MKVIGFSFIKDAIKYDYPIVECINSMLPLTDEVYVAVGESEDETMNLIKDISPKVKIIPTKWDESLREGGRVLAVETDKAYNAIPKDADWCIYLQGDEVLHQDDYPRIKSSMVEYLDREDIDGLLFSYLHFYGSYDYIATSGKWYRHEIRIIRRRDDIYSFQDAMGFRKRENRKLTVADSGATIYHYGWVKDPRHQQLKQKNFHRYWTQDHELHKKVNLSKDQFDYSEIDKLEKFTGSHPEAISSRIDQMNWNFEHDLSQDNRTIKERLRAFISKYTGWYPGEYKNYILKQ